MNPQMFANMWHPSMMAGMPFDPTGAMLMQNKLVVKPKKRGGGPQNSPIKIKHKTWTEWKYYRSHQAAVDDNDDDPLEIRHAAAPRAPRCRARTPRAAGDGYPQPR